MFKEYDTFQLSQILSDETIPRGTCGVVLMVFDGSPCNYLVEFPDGKGGNLGKELVYLINEDFMALDE